MNSHLHAASAAHSAPPGPVGQRGTRATVLLAIKRAGAATAAALADALHCAVNTVRHHLKELEADGVVVHDRSHHGVGAPHHLYRLSASGHALFPDRYGDVLAHLLDHVVEASGRDEPLELLRAHYAELGDRVCAEATGHPAEERGGRIARALDREGFMASWRPLPTGGGVLTEHNCPHRLVAERFPEVCADEAAFLARAFGAKVERQTRIAAGCGCCTYHVATGTPEDAS